jgi:hypothetical protein
MAWRLERRPPNCRWRAKDTISRSDAGVCHRAPAFGSAAGGVRSASSTASAVWRSAVTASIFRMACPGPILGQGRQWPPTGNRPHTHPGVFIVSDFREVPPEHNHGGQFAAFLEHLTDSGDRSPGGNLSPVGASLIWGASPGMERPGAHRRNGNQGCGIGVDADQRRPDTVNW